MQEILARNPRPTWEDASREVFDRRDLEWIDRYQIAYRYFLDTGRLAGIPAPEFRQFWARLEFPNAEPRALAPAPVPAPAPPRGTLAALARDTQNVHTQAVATQTSAMEAKLLEVPVPESQGTEIAMTQAWIRLVSHRYSWGRILRTLTDIHGWFNKTMCRADNDNLYRRLLRGAVAKINRADEPLRDELYKRLWEECYEAVGLCCEGHISRLCNVFVGFDEAFQPPVSLGEVLQAKMSAIAQLDVPTEMKHTHANAVFDELSVPAVERTAWLEAF